MKERLWRLTGKNINFNWSDPGIKQMSANEPKIYTVQVFPNGTKNGGKTINFIEKMGLRLNMSMEPNIGSIMAYAIEKSVMLLNIQMGLKNGGKMVNFIGQMVLRLNMLMVVKNGG